MKDKKKKENSFVRFLLPSKGRKERRNKLIHESIFSMTKDERRTTKIKDIRLIYVAYVTFFSKTEDKGQKERN